MTKTDKIQIIGLVISSLVLVGCLVVARHIKSQYPVEPVGVSIEQAIESNGLEVDYTGLQRYEKLESNYKPMRLQQW